MVRGVDRVKWSNQSVTEKSNDLCYARSSSSSSSVISSSSFLIIIIRSAAPSWNAVVGPSGTGEVLSSHSRAARRDARDGASAIRAVLPEARGQLRALRRRGGAVRGARGGERAPQAAAPGCDVEAQFSRVQRGAALLRASPARSRRDLPPGDARQGRPPPRLLCERDARPRRRSRAPGAVPSPSPPAEERPARVGVFEPPAACLRAARRAPSPPPRAITSGSTTASRAPPRRHPLAPPRAGASSSLLPPRHPPRHPRNTRRTPPRRAQRAAALANKAATGKFSRHVGVSFDARHSRWKASRGKRWCGYHDTEDDAARAVNEAAVCAVNDVGSNPPEGGSGGGEKKKGAGTLGGSRGGGRSARREGSRARPESLRTAVAAPNHPERRIAIAIALARRSVFVRERMDSFVPGARAGVAAVASSAPRAFSREPRARAPRLRVAAPPRFRRAPDLGSARRSGRHRVGTRSAPGGKGPGRDGHGRRHGRGRLEFAGGEPDARSRGGGVDAREGGGAGRRGGGREDEGRGGEGPRGGVSERAVRLVRTDGAWGADVWRGERTYGAGSERGATVFFE